MDFFNNSLYFLTSFGVLNYFVPIGGTQLSILVQEDFVGSIDVSDVDCTLVSSVSEQSEKADVNTELFLSSPRLSATAENVRQSFKKLPTSISQQFESKTCRDFVNKRDNN